MSQPRLNALVVDEKMFRHLVVLEMPKAMRLQYPISVLTIVRADGTGESLAGIVRRLVRAADLVGLVTAQPAGRILLMNAELKGAQMVIDRILAELAGSIFVRWGLACFPATVRTADDLLAQADAAAGLAAS